MKAMTAAVVMNKTKMDRKWTLYFATILLILVQIGPASSSVYDGDEWSEWSEWSQCTRTCEGGVTQQFRRCKSPSGCHGVSIKRKMCNMQSCGEPRDYRGDQCRGYNGVKFDGKRRNWEPVEDPENPCALTCRVEGSNQVVKLSPKLRDGTRCKTGALHVCVDGRCEAVGCDLKIGSPKKIDSCGVCGGDSKSCTSPVYRWDLESKGPCTVRCGGGLQPVIVVCKNSLTLETVDAYFCNTATKPRLDTQSCNIQPCEPQWETGDWSTCGATCGGGLKIRKVFCAQEKNGTKIQVADKLCNHIRRPNNQEPCNPQPCPHWHAGPWSSCSVTCGKGYKTRNVICRDMSNLPSSNCDNRLKPGETKGCGDDEECPLPAASATSSPTAQVINRSPTKKRRVKTTTSSAADGFHGISKSSTTTTSTTTTEDIPAEYQMPDIDNDIYVEEGIPREHTLPLIQPYPPMDNAILFDNNALPSEPTFVAGEWGSCSTTCGEGRRTREVKCKIFLEFSRTIANLPDKECPGPKPVETEPCFSSPCHLGDMGVERLSDVHQAALADSETSGGNMRKTLSVGLPPGMAMQDMTFSWKVLGYTPCSTSCLGGIQEAMIQCVRDYDQRIATPVLCMDKPQPDIATTRTCNDHPCPPRWNVTEFGPCSKHCGGGVMTREVSCIHEVTRGNTVIVPNNICPSGVPRTERLCNTVNCPPYWEAGEWGKCSKPCGGGSRTRSLHCKQVSALGQVVELSNGDLHCNSPKPAETKSCNKKSCSKLLRPGSDGDGDENPEFKDKVTLRVKGKRTVYAGVALRLRCPSGKGLDTGSLIWMKGHEYLNLIMDRMELVHKMGVLKIKNTTYSDSGVYTCVYNGRPVSNITLMIKPYSGDRRDKRPRGRTNPHDSTLYADQQEGAGVSVPMYRGQIITPNSKFYEAGSSSSGSVSISNNFLFHCFLSSIFSWIHWPKQLLQQLPSWERVEKDGIKTLEDEDDSLPKSLRGKALQQNSHVEENYFVKGKDRKEADFANLADDRDQFANSDPKPLHLRPTSSINEEEDELSKVENMLMSKGQRMTSNDSDDEDEEGSMNGENKVRWAVGEWTECLDSECFNWNTALKRRQVACEYPNGTSLLPMMMSFSAPGVNAEEDEPKWGHCNPEEKPIEALECYNPKCTGNWHTHSWSFCKVSKCGAPGFRTRVLKCLWYGSSRPAGHACHSLPRPLVTKSCKGPPCPMPKPTKVNQKLGSTPNKSHHKRHHNHHNKSINSSRNVPQMRLIPASTSTKPQTQSNELLVDYWDLYDQDSD